MAKKTKKAKTVHTALPPCHVSPKLAFLIGQTKVYGGNAKAVRAASRHFDLIVQAQDLSMPPDFAEIPLLAANEEAEALLPKSLIDVQLPATPHVLLDWPDFETPSVAREWWDEFHAWLVAAPEQRVVVTCQGGHGRTGTMLAILAGLGGATTGDPVEFIRKAYCRNAVESEEQLAYIAEVTGLQVRAKPSWAWAGKAQVPETGGSGTAYLPSWATLQDDEGDPPETH